MNSAILSSLAAFFKTLAQCFKESAVCAFLMKIYNAVSASWRGSVIMNKLRGEGKDSACAENVSGKIVSSPFAFLSFLRGKAGDFIEKNISESFICTWAKTYMQNFMAVNTRFFGIMLVCTALTYCAARAHISKIALIAGGFGAVLCIANYNLMSFLNPSKFVCFFKSLAGFKNIDFDFFDEEETHGVKRLVLALIAGAAAGAAMSVNLLYGAALPFAVFALILVMYAPVTGVYAAVFAAPFAPTMALAGICIWTTLSLIIKSVTDRGFKWRFDGVGMCLALFLLVLLLSCITSFARVDSLKVWAMYFVFVIFYFTVINSIRTKEQMRGLFRFLVISGALVALYGILQYIFGWTTSNSWIDEEMFEDSAMRVYSTLGNPNVLGEYLLLVLPVAAVFMLKDSVKSLSKWAYGAAFLALALCLVLTQSRGCWIGFMVSVIIFVSFYEGKLWGVIPLVICILPFVVPQTIVDRIMSVGNMEDSSTSYRVYIWMGTLGMMKHYWPGGIGMGEAAFAQVYPFFSYNAIIAPHSHNLFLQLLVEAGIGGLGIFVVTQGVFLKKMSSVYRSGYKKDTEPMLALAVASGVVGFLVQSMFDYTFYNYRVMALFFMIIGLGMAIKYTSVTDGRNGE